MKTLALVLIGAVGLLVGSQAGATPATLDGSWTGTYTQLRPAALAFTVSGRTADVALGAGHATLQPVALSLAGDRLRFSIPGRPSPLRFDARLIGDRLVGTVSQGALRGSFSARRGSAPDILARGVFAAGPRHLAVVDDPYGPPRLLEPATGRVRGLFPADEHFVVGSGWGTERPAAGTARFGPRVATVLGSRATRVPLRQWEVRFPAGGTTLGGTLTVPAGPGPHPAVVFVAGSGPTERAYLPDLASMLVDAGVGVLVYDKRGIAQSGGRYPGESPTASTIDILARDAEAAIRFLARQPGVDPKRVGLAGHSQAGWIMPLAASREAGARFLIAFAGPTVTADEVDVFQNLTGTGERHEHSLADATAQTIAHGPSGVDPIPWIRSLRIPSLWLFGELDQHVPTELSVRELRVLVDEGDDKVSFAVLATANHALVETKTGLTSEMIRSNRFARTLPTELRGWLAAHRVTGR